MFDGRRLGFVVALMPFFIGCSSAGPTGQAQTANKAESVPAAQQIDVREATPQECSSGGKVYTVYTDSNSNGRRDAEEPSVAGQVVCNGSPGADGHDGLSTLISMTRVVLGAEVCAAGSGVQFSSGQDANKNNLLEPSEINQTAILCDGPAGATGAAGPPGVNGHGMAFRVEIASAEQCPAGGSLILMAEDVRGDHVYDPLSPQSSSVVICNGQSASTPAYSPVEPLYPCGITVAYKEVLLRLANGEVLASFSDSVQGNGTRLVLLPDGSYMDTDASQCLFQLATSLDGKTRILSWGGQVHANWPRLAP